MMNLAPIARIVARYVAGGLLVKAGVDAGTAASIGADADVIAVVQAALGLGLSVVTEGLYILAHKFGWAK